MLYIYILLQHSWESIKLKILMSLVRVTALTLSIQINVQAPYFKTVSSRTGNRTRASWVRARYPNHQTIRDYMLICNRWFYRVFENVCVNTHEIVSYNIYISGICPFFNMRIRTEALKIETYCVEHLKIIFHMGNGTQTFHLKARYLCHRTI